MSGIPEGADYRVSAFDKTGYKICELDTTFHCIWTMPPTIGTAYFTLSTSDPKAKYKNINQGGYILFEHERLGNWGGVICPNNRRTWNAEDKSFTVPVMQAEFQFNRRYAPAGAPITGTAGVVFRKLCQIANDAEDALIRFDGSIWGGGAACDIVDPKNGMLNDLMADIVVKSGVDWWFDPVINPKDGRLNFMARLAKKRGQNNSYVLKEGFNIETPSGDFYIEEGNLVNDALEIGSSATNGEAPKGRSINQASVNEYGLWQFSESQSATDVATVQNAAETLTIKNGQPQRKYLLTAVETPESPNTFSNVNQGDDILIDLYSSGFWGSGNGVDDTGRIISREFSTEDKKLILVTETQNA